MLSNYSSLGLTSSAGFNRINSFLISQAREWKQAPPPGPGPAITVSYQCGAGEHEVSEQLAQILRAEEPKRNVPWAIYDGNLVEKTLDEHHMPKRLAKFIPEDRRFVIGDMTDELLGLHPPEWVIVPKIAETVRHLADAGNVIFVGWGTSIITEHFPNVFHVRLVAALPSRIQRVAKSAELSPQAAAKYIQRKDRGRRRFLKAYFHACCNDQMFHLIINTDRIPCARAAELIAEQARKYFQVSASGTY